MIINNQYSQPRLQQQQAGGVFGAKPGGIFGGTAPATGGGFGFGQTQQANAGGLFPKPATTGSSTFSFGTATSTPSSFGKLLDRTCI